jgi:hypothetical protein
MADVYLFYKYRSVAWTKAHPEDENDSAGTNWTETYIKIMDEHLKEAASAEGMGWSDKLACLKSLQTYHDALSQTRDWVSANHKGWQMLTVEADENGVFKIAVPRPGRYLILVAGRAGFNDAFWKANGVDVGAGATVTVKLSSPEKACVVE